MMASAIGSTRELTAEDVADQAPQLHALPVVAQRALLQIQAENVSLAALAELIGTDQAIATAVLRHVNSAHAMPSRRIANLREAIARVGTHALWEILIQACAEGVLDRGLPPYALPRRVAWRHAATVSAAARYIAVMTKGLAEEASIAGLLHDIGKNALSSIVPQEISRVVTNSRGRRMQLWQAEREFLSFDHGHVGGALLRRWGLPETVSAAVEHHHMAAIVHVADVVAQRLGATGGAGACPAAELDPVALEMLGLTREQVDKDIPDAIQYIEEGGL